MKKFYTILFLFLIISCSKDDSSSDGNNSFLLNTTKIKGINFISEKVIDERSIQVNTDINSKNEFIFVGKTDVANIFILQIGKVNPSNGALSFGNVNNINYDYGNPPSVQLNNWGRAIEVHKSNSSSNYYYRGGNITSENPLFFEFDDDNHRFDGGSGPPSVSANDGNPYFDILTVHENHTKIYYKACKFILDDGKETYNWRDSYKTPLLGRKPRVSINNNHLTVMVFEGLNDGKVYIVKGDFQINGVVNWGKPEVFGTGNEPDVHLSDNGDIVSVFQQNKSIKTRTGLLSNSIFQWSPIESTSFIGTNPSISANFETVILTYNGSTGVNWFHVGKFKY
ncbi:hypothetical protein [Aureivirga sp. CE67]|uniref:hypothetical protein n=1 Tax=Aureivirga sp. CE67 TaxID=1788983 RepID=UPI0018C8E5CB|nr:hypothetical protein [Aureivirga sp. CE67]